MADEYIDLPGIPVVVRGWITEGVALRAGAQLPDAPTPGPAELREALVDCRGRLDRVDELLVFSTRLKAAASRHAVSSRAAHEDKWDQAAARVPAIEYQSSRDRAAQLNLLIVATTRAARQADEQLSLATEAYEVLRTLQRGLDGLRMDLHRMLTAITFESGLER